MSSQCYLPQRYYTQNRIAELRTELVALKSQSDESFAFAVQARSALPDISDLRVTIKDSSESLHYLLLFFMSAFDAE
jgi:hypothetical protein